MSVNIPLKTLDTSRASSQLRAKAIDLDLQKILITRFDGTDQAKDLTAPINCGGYGRIRHFKRGNGVDWPLNPLPIDPACHALGIEAGEMIRAQVFQNAVCNWRCWYCFVDFSLLAANRRHSDFKSCEELVQFYLDQEDPPLMIDLTGGQPDLTPEWVPWMMDALSAAGLRDKVYLWSDDNLSNDYFFRHLSDEMIKRVVEYPMYGRVGCFKGIDQEAFHFNTKAEPSGYHRQFELFERMLKTGIDLYAYATFPTPTLEALSDRVKLFIDRLQLIHEYLPLRTVPLEINMFTPVKGRMNAQVENAMANQYKVIEIWNEEINHRFTSGLRSLPIHRVPCNGQ